MDNVIKYYDIKEDIEEYPEAWCYIITGGRKGGKTYSTLWYAYENKIPFIFCKRTMDDVDILCAGSDISKRDGVLRKMEGGVDLSPFKSINRDKGTNVQAFSIRKGIGAFYNCTEEHEAKGKPVGYIFGLSGVTKFKGFELAESCKDQFIIFDEFIPNIYDRTNINEGTQLLDFYMTVTRDRIERGLNEIKLICLANATNISNSITNTLEITDQLAQMQIDRQSRLYLPEKKIFIHQIEIEENRAELDANTGIYMAMKGTRWGAMTYDNSFSYNDFTNVDRQSIKKTKPVCGFKHNRQTFYIYHKDNNFYVCRSRAEGVKVYDLFLRGDRKKFYLDYCMDIQEATVSGLVKYETYTAYDVIMNFKKHYKLDDF